MKVALFGLYFQVTIHHLGKSGQKVKADTIEEDCLPVHSQAHAEIARAMRLRTVPAIAGRVFPYPSSVKIKSSKIWPQIWAAEAHTLPRCVKLTIKSNQHRDQDS